MVLEIVGHAFACVQTGLELGMGYVAGHDDGPIKIHACAYSVLGEFCAHCINTLVQVYLDALGAFAGTAEFFGDEFRRVGVHLLDPYAVGVDLGFDIAVGTAAYSHSDRAAGTVTGQTDHTDVVGHVFTSELSAEADLLCLFEKFLFQVDVAERTAGLIAGGGQAVIELDACELDGKEILLRRRSADYEGYMVGRAGCRAQRAHLLHQEGNECSLVLDGGLGHGIEIGLVGAAAAFCHHHEAVLVALGGLDIYLRREVALGIHLIVHIQRSVLAVAKVLLGVGIEYAAAQGLFVFEVSPDMLAFLSVDDGGAGILTERKDALDRSFGIAKELQGHVFVVVAGLGIFEDGRHLLVVGAAEHELTVVERLLGDQRECLGRHFQDGLAAAAAMSAEFCGLNEFLRTRNLVILCGIGPKLEHGRILKFCHILLIH